MKFRSLWQTMWKQRVLVAVVASTLVSAALVLCPVYAGNSGGTLVQVNGARALIVIVPILISIMAGFSDRFRIIAGAFMLAWAMIGAFTIGLFYLPVAIWLLWPSRRSTDLRDQSASALR